MVKVVNLHQAISHFLVLDVDLTSKVTDSIKVKVAAIELLAKDESPRTRGWKGDAVGTEDIPAAFYGVFVSPVNTVPTEGPLK